MYFTHSTHAPPRNPGSISPCFGSHRQPSASPVAPLPTDRLRDPTHMMISTRTHVPRRRVREQAAGAVARCPTCSSQSGAEAAAELEASPVPPPATAPSPEPTCGSARSPTLSRSSSLSAVRSTSTCSNPCGCSSVCRRASSGCAAATCSGCAMLLGCRSDRAWPPPPVTSGARPSKGCVRSSSSLPPPGSASPAVSRLAPPPMAPPAPPADAHPRHARPGPVKRAAFHRNAAWEVCRRPYRTPSSR
eukprot:SAG25_NODE_2201_length_1844_cov_270.328358_1_plen_247_part_00